MGWKENKLKEHILKDAGAKIHLVNSIKKIKLVNNIEKNTIEQYRKNTTSEQYRKSKHNMA